ncbi:MAG: hypothetical protein M3063_11275 [Actinomycetota bacterium]|nr:hypothetical protein [Actinomycetota bacterium]
MSITDITDHVAVPSADIAAIPPTVASVVTAGAWDHPASRTCFYLTANPINQRPLSPPGWLSP